MMQVIHRWLKTWEKKIDVIAPVSKFAARKMLDMGLGSENTLVRKNYLMQDPGEGHESRTGAVFVGRLSPEKGTDTLIRAWQQLPHVPLQIIGTGPEEANLQQGMAGNAEVIFCGHLPHGEMLKRIKSAQVLLMPSVWYETFGRTIIEAYATGTPVIVSRLGAMTELVDEGKTGLLFDPGDADDLVQKVTWAMNHPQETAEMGIQARRVFLEKFGADNAYHRLMEVYQQAQKKNKELNA
jgi:glycosyltransferase involved in cell wall biosynthesis